MKILNRFTLLCLSISTCYSAVAQKDFDDLSSRERINIAEREKDEAKTDSQFQQLMQEGHNLFEGKHYLKAIHKYEAAQERRPYNVYPKVIITDIELSMKDTLKTLRQAEREAKSARPPMADTSRTAIPPKEPKLPETQEETIERLNRWEDQVRSQREKSRRSGENSPPPPKTALPTKGDVPQMSVEEYQTELGIEYPQGTTETVEKQGNKTITTRIVVDGDIGNAYRKVVHDWGGVFYFKNGEATTERVWLAETTK